MNLRHFTFFTSLNDSQIKKISDSLKIRKINTNEFVCRKGDPCEGMYLIISGTLQVIEITEDGRELNFNHITANDFFGELSVIDDLPRSADIVAVENSVIGCLPQTEARTLFYHLPEVAESMMRHLAKMVRTSNYHRKILTIPNAYQRVYSYYLSLATKMPGGLIEITNTPKQQKIADLLNTSRETVSRATRELLKDGIVEKDLQRFIIRDINTLKNLSNPSKSSKSSN